MCCVKEKDEEIALAKRCRQTEEIRQKNDVWTALWWVLAAVALCLALQWAGGIYTSFPALIPCSFAVSSIVARIRSLLLVFHRHAEIAEAEHRTRSELNRSVFQAQEAFETQRRCAAQARQELARLRGVATEAQQHGPSLRHAVAVSSHVVGSVVGSVFGRRGTSSELSR